MGTVRQLIAQLQRFTVQFARLSSLYNARTCALYLVWVRQFASYGLM